MTCLALSNANSVTGLLPISSTAFPRDSATHSWKPCCSWWPFLWIRYSNFPHYYAKMTRQNGYSLSSLLCQFDHVERIVKLNCYFPCCCANITRRISYKHIYIYMCKPVFLSTYIVLSFTGVFCLLHVCNSCITLVHVNNAWKTCLHAWCLHYYT